MKTSLLSADYGRGRGEIDILRLISTREGFSRFLHRLIGKYYAPTGRKVSVYRRWKLFIFPQLEVGRENDLSLFAKAFSDFWAALRAFTKFRRVKLETRFEMPLKQKSLGVWWGGKCFGMRKLIPPRHFAPHYQSQLRKASLLVKSFHLQRYLSLCFNSILCTSPSHPIKSNLLKLIESFYSFHEAIHSSPSPHSIDC